MITQPKFLIPVGILFTIIAILNVAYVKHLTKHLGYAQDEIASLRAEKDEANQNLLYSQEVVITASQIIKIMEKPKSSLQNKKVDSLIKIIDLKLKTIAQYNTDDNYHLRRIESREKKYDINKAFLRSFGFDI